MRAARRTYVVIVTAGAVLAAVATGAQGAPSTVAAVPRDTAVALCQAVYGGVFAPPSAEPLAACQWDMTIIHADEGTRQVATGRGVRVGVIDTGIDATHPDVAPNLDLAASCSLIRSDDPAIVAGLSDISEAADGDCADKAAVQDLSGHGTHVASTIAAPVNGVGIAGVAPEATLVALKACTGIGFCFVKPVAAALRMAGDLRLDVVNLSLFADPYLYYCGNDATQRALMREVQSAARYAQQRGVLLVVALGNESFDLGHPRTDPISPDFPLNTSVLRQVGNHCRQMPTELPGVVGVSATGPVGFPGYTMNIAGYSSVGADVAAPGGDYFVASGTIQDGVLAALPAASAIFSDLELFDERFGLPGITVVDDGATYGVLTGTSMAAPHATGVAALIAQRHPTWGDTAVAAALLRTATPLACPAGWAPLFPEDERYRCYGSAGHTSFFGAGLVDARRAVAP